MPRDVVDDQCSIMGGATKPLVQNFYGAGRSAAAEEGDGTHDSQRLSSIEKIVYDEIVNSEGKKTITNVMSLVAGKFRMEEDDADRCGADKEASMESAKKSIALSAVSVRRKLVSRYNGGTNCLTGLPFKNDLQYVDVEGRNCENCIGYVAMPVGVTGKLSFRYLASDGGQGGPSEAGARDHTAVSNSASAASDANCDSNSNNSDSGSPRFFPPRLKCEDVSVNLPIATTEGGLIASVSRGCKAITLSNSMTVTVVKDGITRSPCLEFKAIGDVIIFANYVRSSRGNMHVKESFENTTKHGKLLSSECTVVGKLCYLRLTAETGEAMGMNMVSKGTQAVLNSLLSTSILPKFKVITLSGNTCSDKKNASINFIKGRGKYVTAEAVITHQVLETVLKTTAVDMFRVNYYKNNIGSSIAGSIGSCNAHAANIVAGIYLATGQDPGHVVEGSLCTTVMEVVEDGLYCSVTLPCVCVGTIGGGTHLKPQHSLLELLKCDKDGGSKRLAAIVAGGVMAGELSLVGALAKGDLVRAHMKLNRR